jgi:ATP-dependent helicase/nuclease subunit A
VDGKTLFPELDEQQLRAAITGRNAVVSAGAGSGKTKVLAARYAYLVMERKYRVEEILALTFTNKAANEMYSRIYGLLASHQDNPEARQGLADFHRARICTLDSFLAGIARGVARLYGISPDFQCDDPGVRELALEAALPFVLEHRDNPALQTLMAYKKIRTVAEELFAETVVKHSPISNPLDFAVFVKIQGEEILRRWDEKTKAAAVLVEALIRDLGGVTKKSLKIYETLSAVLLDRPVPDIPGIEGPLNMAAEGGERFRVYFDFLYALKSTDLRGGNSAELAPIVAHIKTLKGLYGELESMANMALQSRIATAVFPLMDTFQAQFNRKKREAGILGFNDIARLAVDALSRYPEIRKTYKAMFRAVMIDEFQDNNGLQRDLIFLLAEKPGRDSPGIPRNPEELCPGKMFFVGDEKQSIYRFRGADVSVFRSLSKTLSASPDLSLIYNYRSDPLLIDAFNRIFGGLDPSPRDEPAGPGVFLRDDGTLSDFEAAYTRIHPSRGAAAGKPPVYFCLFDEDRTPKKDPRGLSPFDHEAAFIAGKIRELVAGAYLVRDRDTGNKRPCAYGDFAVLQRHYTHQYALEKYFKEFGIPFNADRPAGIFSDAPVNDLYNLLRLLVYPGDRIAYAALVRSPFMRLSDLALSVCMLDESGVPFNEALEEGMPPEERGLYRRARALYLGLTQAARILPLTELVTKLWYGEGYRYETIWSAQSQGYAELFDLFFELARTMERRGKGLVDFVDYLEDLINREERPEELDVPAEREAGARIMSIHKSKGLEFPVVFIYLGGGSGRNKANTEAVYFNERWGLTINLPQAEELPENSGNYFFNLHKAEEEQKNTAELRRLLYVAMTRAESALFMTASLPRRTREEKNGDDPENAEYSEASVKNRLAELAAKKRDSAASSFLDLLLPVIGSGGEGPFFIQPIPPFSRDEPPPDARRARPSMREAAERAAELYARAELIAAPPPEITGIPAGSLRYIPAGLERARGVPGGAEGGKTGEADAVDRLLEGTGLGAADFGILVHGFLAARFNGAGPEIPPEISAKPDKRRLLPVLEAARTMAEGFFSSELGRRCQSAALREAEFPVLTSAAIRGKTLAITGRIDLLFESEDAIHIVDFKTDRVQDPRRHLGQIAVYRQAVLDIFHKPVRCWLFYLRSGTGVELTDQAEQVDMTALAFEGAQDEGP